MHAMLTRLHFMEVIAQAKTSRNIGATSPHTIGL
jgi:hypothetical protein